MCEALADGARRPLLHAQGRRRAGTSRGPPFQAKTKAGNVNAWLDHVGELGLDYDVFVQLDIDHRPRPELSRSRRSATSATPTVAWVQAPSVCGNLDNWTARGLAEQDLVFQGPLQMGFYGAQPHAVHHRLAHDLPDRGDPRDRRLPADARRGPPRHGGARRRAATRGSSSRRSSPTGDGPHDFGTYLRPAVRVGVLDDPDLPPSHAAPAAAVTRPAGAPVPDVPELVHALVAVARRSSGCCRRSRCSRTGRSPTSRSASTSSTSSPVPLMSTPDVVLGRRWFQPSGLRLSLARHRCSRSRAGRSCCGR